MNKNNVIYKIRSIDSNFINLETLLFVDIDTQSLLHIKKGTVLKKYIISSSYYGTGSRENSFKTPLGRHEIYKKIGSDLPVNAILKGRGSIKLRAVADIEELGKGRSAIVVKELPYQASTDRIMEKIASLISR